LDDSEYEIIKKHPEMSYKIIRPVDSYNDISSMVLHHHERWDGGGYPHGLKKKNIPHGSRILCVADSFDALTSDRPYRKSRSIEFALEVLFEGREGQFDPEIVEIAYNLIKRGIIK